MADWAMGRFDRHCRHPRPTGAFGYRGVVRVCAAAIGVALLLSSMAGASTVPEMALGSSESLRQTWAQMRESADPSFKEPLRLQSRQSKGALGGTLYAVLDRPFAEVRRALGGIAGWCGVLVLDPNVHRCRSAVSGDASHRSNIEVGFGRTDMPVAFVFQSVASDGGYLHVRLAADQGPFGTTDYAIALEAAPLDPNHTVVHLGFSQRFGWTARLAMLAYFNTVGRGKVGFTVVDRDTQGHPVYAGDLRGGLERNLMRYYFAIVAYLDSLSVPREQQADRRVRTWLAYTDRYPLQLHEDADYFARKSPDVRRQQSGE